MLHCTSTDWSAVSSATANATLAGVLAGFMINGIVLLLSTTPATRQRAGYVQGAGLLFTALVALGLDAYLFGLVTGDTADRACRRAWTEAMFAAGLLGVGAVAVVVAIVFLLGVFFGETSATAGSGNKEPVPGANLQPSGIDESKALKKSNDMLSTICVWLRPGVAAVVVSFFLLTARSYLSAVFNGSPPSWANTLLIVMTIVDYAAIILFVAVYNLHPRKRDGNVARDDNVRQATPDSPPSKWIPSQLWKHLAGPQKEYFVNNSILNGFLNWVWEELQPDGSGEVTTLNLAIFCSLIYSVASAGAAGLAILSSVTFWNSPTAGVAAVAIALTVIWVLLVSLLPLSALLAPAFGPQRAHDDSDQGNR